MIENIIGFYIVIAFVSGALLAMTCEDGLWFLRCVFWPLYLLAFVWADLKEFL